MRGALGIVAVVAGLAAAGCRNSCQEICSRMADYAKEECGYSVTDGEIGTCVERMGSSEKEDKQACRDLGSPEAIRAQWSCEDLEPYWSPDAA